MGKTRHFVRKILPGSIAQEMDIQAGDEVLSINGSPIEDIFDYQFLIQDENIDLLLRKPDGEEWLLEIEKDEDEDLGLEFENSLMDEYRSCSNRCIFCFIDQMPPGMRETLYFKDDDSRLSFLQGNYVTLTNMKEHDLDRMIRYRLEPINISVHTTNPELRCRMLRNRFAGDVCEKIRKLYRAEDMVRAGCGDCQGCSACCHRMGNSIIVDPLDIYRLNIQGKVGLEELFSRYLELHVEDGIILPNLKMTGPEEACGFQDQDGRCSVHPSRPGLCRLFPLGRFYENWGFRYFLQILPVFSRDQHFGDTCPPGSQQLLLQPSDGQHRPPQSNFSGHSQMRIHFSAGKQGSQGCEKRDAGRRPVLGHRSGRYMNMNIPLLQIQGIHGQPGLQKT